jgi:hypothetical protein
MSNVDDRNEGSLLFGEYLISSCWRKMARRIGHWAAVGLIYNLWKLSDQDVFNAFLDKDPKDRPTNTDFKLSTYILFLDRTKFLKGLLSYHAYSIPPDSPHLQNSDSTEANFVLPYLQKLSGDRSDNLYNKDTVVEFHHLLVAAMICYATGLRTLRQACSTEKDMLDKKDKLKAEKVRGEKKASKAKLKAERSKVAQHDSEGSDFQLTEADFLILPDCDSLTTPAAVEEKQEEKQRVEKRDQELPEDCTFTPELDTFPSSADEETVTVEDAVGGVLFAVRLLNAIVVSGAFQRHIRLLVDGALLKIPSDKEQDMYEKFSVTKVMPWQQSRKTRSTGVLENLSESDGSGDPVSEGMEDNLEMDQEPWESMTKEQDIMAVQGWIKNFVQHLHAKSVLESYARHVGNRYPIEIKTYGLCFPTRPLPMPTWETVKEIIRSSLFQESEDEKEKFISIFKGHFPSQREGGNNIFNLIGDIIEGKKGIRQYHVHCEVALASLVAALSGSLEKMECYADEGVVKVLQVGLVPPMHCISVRPFLRL